MNQKGGLHPDRGLIALTGIFLAAVALSACGNEEMTELRTGHGTRPDRRTEVARFRKEKIM